MHAMKVAAASLVLGRSHNCKGTDCHGPGLSRPVALQDCPEEGLVPVLHCVPTESKGRWQ